ncbi:ribosomal protein L22 [Sodiomyces alkalinus F11]|uniref:Ribosomal protein L22 n=1 Tax=Sodiomyces alkalinus (strain CBS 110278 / VKM F-3762 / F11) TaxID=1314773 RepID=A0A3N2PPU0_SODAK|nr:ribosomal protein L22 [Sodiomyces alkalinus F11]ROT36518.1 ribosomal protein L22 [Sodiomyces alkalinus F11]
MSAHIPSRRIALVAPSALYTLASSNSLATSVPLVQSQRRTKWSISNWFNRGSNTRQPESSGQDLDDPKVRARVIAQQQQSKAPSLSDSIFEDEVKAATGGRDAKGAAQARQPKVAPPEAAAWRIDPDPRARTRWERKKVIQMVRQRTAAEEPSAYARRMERIAATEKELLHRSAFLETSVKKLVMLARQIQGKTLEEALVQMRFSKKKMAAEVKFHLEEARDLAVVSRGMGLGKVNKDATPTPVKIQTKDGETIKVDDPSGLYVAQAWVNKGPIRFRRIEYKARARTGLILRPSTGISVVLKEERTRIREHNEQVAKEAKRKPWVHLPNRPVTAQRPYYSW